MTSQIAVFNSLGVAVASDTVTTHTSENGAIKTTNNAEKIWPVGDGHNVVILHSGGVHLNGLHLRLLVSEWAKSLDGHLPELIDYATNFIDWMGDNAHLMDRNLQMESVQGCLNDHYNHLRWKIQNSVNAEAIDELDPNFANAIAELIASELEDLRSLEDFASMTQDDSNTLLQDYQIDIQHKIEHFFHSFPGYEQFVPALIEQAELVLCKEKAQHLRSTLSFVGFGTNDFLAGNYRLGIRAFYGDRLHFTIDERFGIQAGEDGAIHTFAQDDAIHGFISGAEWRIIHALVRKVESTINELPDLLAVEPELVARLRDEIYNHFENFRYEKYVSPLLSTIGGLSLKGCSELAESLVGIQAIRSAGGEGPASVGGFIESLVIDRAVGVRWIKKLPS